MHRQRRENLEASAGILRALVQGIDHREDVFACIKDAPSTDAAVTAVHKLLGVSEEGARAILDMQVRRFSDAEREKVTAHLTLIYAELDSRR
ncbi:DNA gyrase subunit A [Glutamicibacter sp.]|jgi:Type IIA topoisomerase (DNA gyrase/topo II, topoisomerase IV), A subunit|uniref:DNA gyrase subunit A n=1 Tax=Glutamicibacter sp. TaxID=1931995 RepID=UPI002B495AA1|nr:DNA gyrase subunit A [Glutamicibacter sp.]HJX80367.1 DNA gyrase subunit A [Glutamicibacter sp.]